MYFGCDNENCALSQCCDACQPDLKLQWTFDAILTSMQKAVLHDKLVQLLSYMNCMLDPFIVERIVFDAHLYNSPSLLVSEFGLQEVFSVRIASMFTSFLQNCKKKNKKIKVICDYVNTCTCCLAGQGHVGEDIGAL